MDSGPARAPRWRSAAHAMGQMGCGAAVSGLLSAGAAKIIAAVLGPAGVAVLGTLQQCREAGTVAATLSGQAALVQGASGLSGSARREFLRTAMCLFGVATLAVGLLMVGAPGHVLRAAGLGVERASLIRWLSIPIGLASLYIFLNALVSALGAVRASAALQLAAPGALLLLAYPAALGASRSHESWFLVLLGFSASVPVLAAAATLARYRDELKNWMRGPGLWWSRAAARRFFVLSVALLTTGLVSNWSLVLVRGRILRAEGLTVTGQFDAAWSIALNLSALLLASVQAYYLPVLAKAPTAAERAAHLEGMLRVASPVAAVLIAAVAAFRPLILRLLYSPEFDRAALYLRWFLPGVYLKATAWAFAALMLSRADTKVFLAAELGAWATFVAGTAALAPWRSPAESAAISFVLMYAVHFTISSGYVLLSHGFRWDSWRVWLAGLGMVGATSAAFWRLTPQQPLRAQLGWGIAWVLAGSVLLGWLLRRGGSECAA